VLGARRRLGVNDSHQPGFGPAVERVQQCLVRDDLTPRPRPRRGAPPSARSGDEEAGITDDDNVPGGYEIHDAGLHPGHPGRLQRQRDAILQAVYRAEHLDKLEQELVERRVEMAEHRLAHRVQHGRLDVRGTRTTEEPVRRGQRWRGRQGGTRSHQGRSYVEASEGLAIEVVVRDRGSVTAPVGLWCPVEPPN